MRTIIADYDSGNLRSAANMLAHLGVSYEITSDAEKILNAERIIFPGQGHFGQAVKNLEQKGLISVIKEACTRGVPFLGICAGLQILFESSEEAPGVSGLGIFKGKVKKFTQGRIPQIGWSRVTPASGSIIPAGYYYFVHSYYAVPDDEKIISASSCYGEVFCAAVQKDNITAVQFHPEKSAEAGIEFFKRWLEASK